MTTEEAQRQGLISQPRKHRIDGMCAASFFVTLFVTMFLILYFGFGVATNAKVEATHSQFHAVTGVVDSKGPLLGGQREGNGELQDHYRLKVRFTDSTGRVRNPEAVFSWRLKNRPTVTVFDGPGSTYDIPGAIEGSHPRNPTLKWIWLAGVVLSLVIGLVIGFLATDQVEKLLLRPYTKKAQNGPVPAI